MDRSSCPSCGSSYNGKRCRNCGYEHFSEEIRHGNHTHRGEPLVIDSPTRKPIPRKDTFSCDKKTRKKHPLVRFLVLLALIQSLIPMLRNWGLKLEAMEDSRTVVAIRPEPILIPENTVVFHQEDGITLFTTPEQFVRPDDFCLYVHNESPTSVTVSARDIQVNGVALPHAALVCKARSGEIGKGWLEPDIKEWETAGIQEISTLVFRLTVLGQDGRILFHTDEIHLTAEATEKSIL